MPIDGDITPPSSPSGSGTTADPWATSAEVLGAAFGATIEESKLLFERCLVVKLSEGQELFRVGDSSKGGAYAVVTGEMGMWVPQSTGGDEGGAAPAVRVAILRNGEAIGKLDLLDGGLPLPVELFWHRFATALQWLLPVPPHQPLLVSS